MARRAEKGLTMKISARNVLKGKVVEITHGVVNTEVVVELPGGAQIVSVITKSSAENLELTEGVEICRRRQGQQCHPYERVATEMASHGNR